VVLGADLPVHHPLDRPPERRAGDGRSDALPGTLLEFPRRLPHERRVDARVPGDGLDLAQVERAARCPALALELGGAVEDRRDLLLAVGPLPKRLDRGVGSRRNGGA
jgi:hypothetical protein